MDKPTLTEVLGAILDTWADQVHTAMPGKIMSYDHATQTAYIQPQLGLGLPVIPSVPVVWPLVYGDLSVGDTVLCIFCEADIDLWRSQGEAGEPLDRGKHGLHSAVAIAGLRPASSPLTHVAGSTVVPGSDVRLSSPVATERVIKGDSLANSVTFPGAGFLAALEAWAIAVSAAAGLGGPTLPALKTAIGDVATGLGGPWLSTEVKVP